ncbi:MAG: protein kinase [Sandaracinaceae bacterium]
MTTSSPTEDEEETRTEVLARPFRLGRYSVFASLARGGQAEILAAVQGDLGHATHIVAVKRILAAPDAEAIDMMFDEARIASRIRHPHVVQVHDFFELEDEPYIVMEHLVGVPLDTLIDQTGRLGGRLDVGMCLAIAAQAAAGLHAAHELRNIDGRPADVVHRDVSPQNLFVTHQGFVKVLDFGIASASERRVRTQTGQIKGKPSYMSPEQITGKPVDRRTDVFALGVVLFEMLTGRRLFKRDSLGATAAALLEAPIPPVSQFRPHVPQGVQEVVTRALQRDPTQRFPSAREMQLALLRLHRDHFDDVAPDLSIAKSVVRVAPHTMRAETELLQLAARLSRDPEPTLLDGAVLPVSAVAPTVAAPRPTRRKWPWLALGLVGGLGAMGGAAVVMVSSPPADGVEAEPQVGAEPPIEQELGTAPEPAPEVEVAVAPPEADPDAGPTTPAEAVQTRVTVEVDASPEGAVVWIDGAAFGPVPLVARLPQGEAPVQLEVRAEGHRTWSSEIEPTRNHTLRVQLEPQRAGRRGRGTPRDPGWVQF